MRPLVVGALVSAVLIWWVGLLAAVLIGWAALAAMLWLAVYWQRWRY